MLDDPVEDRDRTSISTGEWVRSLAIVCLLALLFTGVLVAVILGWGCGCTTAA